MLESGGRETEKRHQRDVRDGSINPSRSVVAARERLSSVFRGSLGAYSPRACSQVSGRSDILRCSRVCVMCDSRESVHKNLKCS